MGVVNRRATSELSTYRSAALFSVVVVFTVTSTVSVILRLVAKRLSKMRLAREDYTILAAQFLLYGMGACAILEIFMGSAGHHAIEAGSEHVVEFLKILVALQVFYGTILGLIKVSICLFYIRIFFTRQFRIAAWTVIGFITSWSVMVVLTAFLLCTPLAFNWNQTIKGGRCANQPATFIAVGVLDLAVDCAVVVLPLPSIYKLQTSKGNKLALFGIFGLGLFTMIISCLRIQALVSYQPADITFTAAYPVLWSFLEPAIGITVACGPLFWPLLKKLRVKRRFTSTKGEVGSKQTFQRLDEPAHRLINYSGSKVQTTVTAKKTKSGYFENRDPAFENNKATSEDGSILMESLDGGITVKREWQMETEMEGI